MEEIKVLIKATDEEFKDAIETNSLIPLEEIGHVFDNAQKRG